MNVCLLYQPMIAEAGPMAERLAPFLSARGHEVEVHSIWNGSNDLIPATADVVVTFGGDGSLLRAAHLAALQGVPIVGVNLGRVGFLADVDPDGLPEAILPYLEGEAWVDERLLLEAGVRDGERPFVNLQPSRAQARLPLLALNEVFVGRGAIGRLVKLDVKIDGVRLEHFRADGVIVATPTGSTAYALAAGGPVVSPDLDAMVLVSVAAQTTPLRALVLPASRTVEITVSADHAPVLSSDGLLDVALMSGDTVVVKRSPLRAHFLRAHPAEDFYASVRHKLR